eukprot:12400774-Karenia_brevis.AAC.1
MQQQKCIFRWGKLVQELEFVAASRMCKGVGDDCSMRGHMGANKPGRKARKRQQQSRTCLVPSVAPT